MVLSWNLTSIPVNNKWRSVCYGYGLFVAVGSSGTGNRIITSPDGVDWTARSNPVDNNWTSICYGNGLFVAVSETGSGDRVMTSSNGIDWLSQTTPADNSWNAVCFGTLSDNSPLFVATATDGFGNGIMISSDGINWSSIAPPNDGFWNDVTYGRLSDNTPLFVAISNQFTNSDDIMISSNGVNWSLITSGVSDYFSIHYGNGLFVASSMSYILTSSDGVNWSINTNYFGFWKNLTYGNGFFLIVSDSQYGADSLTSTDGINWSYESTASINRWVDVAYGNNTFVTVSDTESGLQSSVMIATSISCYNKGSKVLCLINEIEVYIPIENITKHTLVKTLKHGYVPTELIGRKKFINNYNNEDLTQILYKSKINDLIISGGHYVLVEKLPEILPNHPFYESKIKVEDDFVILACHSTDFEKLEINGVFELYHIILNKNLLKDPTSTQNDEIIQYGIYVNDFLSESTSMEHFKSQGFIFDL